MKKKSSFSTEKELLAMSTIRKEKDGDFSVVCIFKSLN